MESYFSHSVLNLVVLLQLDTWFGTKKKEKGRGSGGQLPRPHSESDFNEVAEQEFFVEQLDADETFLNEKFEEMLVCIMNSIEIMDTKKVFSFQYNKKIIIHTGN